MCHGKEGDVEGNTWRKGGTKPQDMQGRDPGKESRMAWAECGARVPQFAFHSKEARGLQQSEWWEKGGVRWGGVVSEDFKCPCESLAFILSKSQQSNKHI